MPHRKSTRRFFWILISAQGMVGTTVALAAVRVTHTLAQNGAAIDGDSLVPLGAALAAVGALIVATWHVRGLFEDVKRRLDGGDAKDLEQDKRITAIETRMGDDFGSRIGITPPDQG